MTYKVGYGKPPVNTRFKKGQSGNPAGRKKGTRNISTLVREALSAKVVINVNGEKRTVSKLDAACMQQANKAAAGDLKATKLLIDILVDDEHRGEVEANGGDVTPEKRRTQNAKVLAALRARVMEQDNG